MLARNKNSFLNFSTRLKQRLKTQCRLKSEKKCVLAAFKRLKKKLGVGII